MKFFASHVGKSLVKDSPMGRSLSFSRPYLSSSKAGREKVVDSQTHH